MEILKAGPEIAPHINAVFDGGDCDWKRSILAFLGPNMNPETAVLLKPNIKKLASGRTGDKTVPEVRDVAREAVARWGW